MTKTEELLSNKQLSCSLIIGCLATCESVISRNAYLEKKWGSYCDFNCFGNNTYQYERLSWMKYRDKLRSLLFPIYSMREIIQKTKACTAQVSQNTVKKVIALIDSNDFILRQ